ncbi:MAG: hypothetical protein NTV95_01135 [Candidatus Saccharibacteria bacterium]|nr:hypothetical protein [Candidatus Saccharibacteria bacterium]
MIICFNILIENTVDPNHYFRLVYSLFILLPASIVCALYIVIKSKDLNLQTEDLIKIFVIAGLCQSVISVIALLFPTIKSQLVEIMFQNTGDQLLNTPWIVERRFFGFANSMLDLYGFGMGLIAGASLFIKYKYKYMKYIVFGSLLIPAFLNARTGVLIGAIGMIVYLAYELSTINTIKVLGYLLGYFLIIVFLLALMAKYAPDTLEWSKNDINSFILKSDSFGNRSGTANNLFSSNFWTLPEYKYFFQGTGHTLYSAKGFSHSDVGFVNDVWRSGFIGIFLLYVPFFIFLKNSITRVHKNISKYIITFFTISILTFLIKGNLWVYSPGMVFILSVTAMFNIEKRIHKC